MDISEVIAKHAKDNGFDSVEEMHRLIGSIDLTDHEKLGNFKTWEEIDGPKAGLLKFFPELSEGEVS